MTTWTAGEDQALADALTRTAAHLERRRDRAARAVREMASVATPGNGYRVASVPFKDRPPIVGALRVVAAGGDPLAGRLREIAAELEESVAARAANGG